MIIQRAWSMASKNTFTIKPIAELLNRHLHDGDYSIDPFANVAKIATVTNDLNPDIDTDYHMDALDFLKLFEDESVDVVLYDPPYSPRQVSEHYKGFGYPVTQKDTSAAWRARHLDEIARVLKSGGKAICFGWNTNGVGKKRGMELVEILLVAHGGSKHDTSCTVEIKK